MNVLGKSAIRNCTSCGVCASVCIKKAITIQLDRNGFYRPMINSDLCNDCGLCTTVCYKFDNDVKMTSREVLEGMPLYSAWSNNDDLVIQTTSGGIGDLLAHQLYKNGYKVLGVVYNEDKTRAEHRIARDENDLLFFRGSKYIQSYTYDAFKEVLDNYRNEKYAVFGTPCQIYALNRLAVARKIRNNFFFVDLYCHGCPSLHTWSKYQADIKNKIGVNRFDKVSFRSKKKGWGSIYIFEAIVNGESVYIGKKTNEKFYELFFSELVLNEACYDCRLRSTLKYTDIRLGDFWGHKYLNNQRGVSAISIATDRGQKVFNSLKAITISQCSYDEFLPYQSWERTYKVDVERREAVLASLSDSHVGIDDAIKVLRQCQGFKSSAIRHIKTILAIFPLGFTNSIKKIVYKIR